MDDLAVFVKVKQYNTVRIICFRFLVLNQIYCDFSPGAFLIPYLLMLVLLGVPLLYMELIVGQYTRRGPVHALATVCPLLKGTQGLNIHQLLKCIQTKQSFPDCKLSPLDLVSVHRRGPCISCHLLHHEHLLQSRHHLGPLLSLQLFPGPSAMGELQQHLELTTLYQSGLNQQQQLLDSQPGILQVHFVKWEKPLLCLSVG